MPDQERAKRALDPSTPSHLSVGASVFKEKRSNQSSRKDEAAIASQPKTMFHDFLGSKPTATDSPVVLAHKNVDASPSVSVSHGGASSGGVRTPHSSTSDLASSERNRGRHLEGAPRNEFSAGSNRMQKNKRSNSDSAFTASTKEGAPRIGHDSLESFNMKMFKSSGGERPKRPDELYHSAQAMRPASGTLIVHPNLSKWERSIPGGGAAVQYPHGNQFIFPNQAPSNRLRDSNTGSSVVSHTAADEGSRTGMKGTGILNSITVNEKSQSGILPSSSKHKGAVHTADPECSPSSNRGIASSSRQMTIFYGGQAHVFDDVHPNKADVIMALAGSNGGSWSTTYSAKSVARSLGEGSSAGGELEGSAGGGVAQLRREPRGRLSIVTNASHELSPGDTIAATLAGKSGAEERILN